MAKVTLPSIASGYNPATINSNFQIIADQLNNRVLYRMNVGAEPNQMSNLLDMNNFRIINLPAPLTDGEPFRKKDATDLIATANGQVAQAQAYANAAGNSALQAANAAGQAASSALQVLTEGAQLKAELIAEGATIASQAFQAAAASQASANQSAASALVSEGHSDTAMLYSEDSADSAALAQSIADSLAGGTIGFDAVAYDFGLVADPTTYFNRDFGNIV